MPPFEILSRIFEAADFHLKKLSEIYESENMESIKLTG